MAVARAVAVTALVLLATPVPARAGTDVTVYVVAGLDGGPASDVVVARGVAGGTRIEVRRGGDAAVRWAADVAPAYAVLPLRSRTGRLLALGETVRETVDVPPVAGAENVTLTIRARDAAGGEAWRWESAGTATTTPAAVTVRELPEVAGVLHGRGGDAVLVTRTDALFPRAGAVPATTKVTVAAVRAADGTERALSTSSGDGAGLPRVVPVGDLTRDGTDDYVVLVPVAGGAGRVEAIDGATGTTRWVSAVAHPLTAEVAAVATGVLLADADSGIVTVLAASSGSILWRRPATQVVVTGPDVVLVAGRQVEARTPMGAVRWRHTVAAATLVEAAGDLDGDGLGDVRLGDGRLLAAGDGRTLGRSSARPLLADVDGVRGADLARVAGRNAYVEAPSRRAWSRTLPAAPAPWTLAAEAAVRLAPRCAGVLVVGDDGTLQLHDGRSGAPRWRVSGSRVDRHGASDCRARAPGRPSPGRAGTTPRPAVIPATGLPPVAASATLLTAFALATARGNRWGRAGV